MAVDEALWQQLAQLVGLAEVPEPEGLITKTIEWVEEHNRSKMEQSLRMANLEARLKGSENRVKTLEAEVQQERDQGN